MTLPTFFMLFLVILSIRMAFFVDRSVFKKKMMQIAKLFQSMKFSGVARLSAAVPMSPSVAGLRPAIIPLNM